VCVYKTYKKGTIITLEGRRRDARLFAFGSAAASAGIYQPSFK